MKKSDSIRIMYWDNMKAMLIFLVVLGHFLLPIQSSGLFLQTIYTWIYLFHMPAFIFVSGYFSKKYVQKPSQDTSKLIGYLILYLLFSISLWLIQIISARDISMLFIFSPYSAQWYLLCMFFWYLLIPHCAKIRPTFLFPLTVLISLVVGFDYGAGAFLALSRCIVFFPFFLAGYYFEYSLVSMIKTRWKISSWGLIIAFILIYRFPEFFNKHIGILYGDCAYDSLITGTLLRFIWYGVAGLLIVSLICITPKEKHFFSYIGQRTLPIYVFHRIAREVFEYTGFYNVLSKEWIAIVACFSISVFCTFIFSAQLPSKLLNKASSCSNYILIKQHTN